MVNANSPTVSRFMKFVRRCPSGCWLWSGCILKNGYGQFWLNDKNWKAHRVSYLLFKGRLIEGLVIDHLCRNRACVNPDHLELVTHRTNLLRGETLNAKELNQTHCKRGHPFDDGNTYVDPSGSRSCRTCLRAKYKAYRQRKKVNAASLRCTKENSK